MTVVHHIPHQATLFRKTIRSDKYEETRIKVYDT